MRSRSGSKLESAKQIWETALGELQIQVSKANYTTWLKNSQGISYQENVFVVGVPSAFVAEWLTKSLHSLVRKTLAQIIGGDVDVQFTVHNQNQLTNGSLAYANQPDGGISTKAKIDRFNPKYTFDNFIVGDCNRLAYAATIEVAENPGHSYNPLFIYSSTGQGKTHLLHAIGHVAISNGLKVAYTSAEQFTNEFVLAIKQGQVEDFRDRLRTVHIFLFDDIQFISDKKQTQQCFLQAFNDLYNNNRQIIITADCPPKDMALLSNKLKSRLEWGLVTPIQPPDFESRLSILRAKAKETMIPITDEVLQLLAKQIRENVRQLEGALIYLTARTKLTGMELTLQTVNRLLTSTADKQGREVIMQVVADYFNLTVEELTGKRRDRKTALARQIVMYLMREEGNCSFAEIGKGLGNRNHATIVHGYEKIAAEMSVNSKLYHQILGIKGKIDLSKASREKY